MILTNCTCGMISSSKKWVSCHGKWCGGISEACHHRRHCKAVPYRYLTLSRGAVCVSGCVCMGTWGTESEAPHPLPTGWLGEIPDRCGADGQEKQGRRHTGRDTPRGRRAEQNNIGLSVSAPGPTFILTVFYHLTSCKKNITCFAHLHLLSACCSGLNKLPSRQH